MANVSRVTERSPSELKQVVVANLRKLKEHRAKALGAPTQGCSAVPGGLTLQEYYDSWGQLSELERAYVFRIEAVHEHQEQAGQDRAR
jgi:hypothetical protein